MLLMKSRRSSAELCLCVLSCSETAKPTDSDKSDEEEKGERFLSFHLYVFQNGKTQRADICKALFVRFICIADGGHVINGSQQAINLYGQFSTERNHDCSQKCNFIQEWVLFLIPP